MNEVNINEALTAARKERFHVVIVVERQQLYGGNDESKGAFWHTDPEAVSWGLVGIHDTLKEADELATKIHNVVGDYLDAQDQKKVEEASRVSQDQQPVRVSV